MEANPTEYDPSNNSCDRVTEPSIVCFVPNDNSANSPGLPPKNSAGTKDIGCLMLLLYSIKELI